MEECGCHINLANECAKDYCFDVKAHQTIAYCSMHQAASAMKEALRKVDKHFGGFVLNGTEVNEVRRTLRDYCGIREALSRANEGREDVNRES